MNEKVKSVLNSVLERFESGDIPEAIAYSMFPFPEVPSACWSLLNRTLMFLSGTMDARGIRQWNKVKRFVNKGSKWQDAVLYFWSIQGRNEVDFVIEAEQSCVALELKSGSRWQGRDLAGLNAFLKATPHCKAAILCHNGEDAVKLGERLWPLPINLILS